MTGRSVLVLEIGTPAILVLGQDGLQSEDLNY